MRYFELVGRISEECRRFNISGYKPIMVRLNNKSLRLIKNYNNQNQFDIPNLLLKDLLRLSVDGFVLDIVVDHYSKANVPTAKVLAEIY